MALSDGLLCFYKLGEADNADRVDTSGSGPNLAATNSPKLLAAGKLGGCVATGGASGDSGPSGASSYLILGAGTPSNFFDLNNGDRTLSVWVKFNSTANQPGILSNWGNVGGGVVQWLLWYNGTASRLSFRTRSSLSVDTDVHADTPNPVATGTWYHIIITRTAATGAITIRVNGGTKYSATGATTLLSGTNSFACCARNSGTPVVGFTDAFGMWDRVLTDDEQTALYNDGTGLQPPLDQPVAAFSASVSSGIVPFNVTFTDSSTNTPSSWLWDFGDGQTSTQQNPTHTYDAPGNYTVTLTATNSAGSDQETSSIVATNRPETYASRPPEAAGYYTFTPEANDPWDLFD